MEGGGRVGGGGLAWLWRPPPQSGTTMPLLNTQCPLVSLNSLRVSDSMPARCHPLHHSNDRMLSGCCLPLCDLRPVNRSPQATMSQLPFGFPPRTSPDRSNITDPTGSQPQQLRLLISPYHF